MDKELKLVVQRTTRPGDGLNVKTYWQSYTINISEDMYVLDALQAAWLLDQTLMFRHSCHHASCGSCGMRLNGREGLACITPAFERARNGVLKLEPLRNFPIVADLVVDTQSLAQNMERVRAHAIQEEGSALRFSNCIECGLCVSACPISAINRNYLGPAVLAAGSKNFDKPEVRAQLGGHNGVWRCHDIHECTEVCPANVQPALAIGMVRIDLVKSIYKKKE